MKNKLYLLAVPTLLAGSVNATSISLDFVNMDPNNGNAVVSDGTDTGTIDRVNDSSGLPYLTTYTITSLDVNGDSVADTFSFVLTATGTVGGVESNVATRGSGANNGYELSDNTAIIVGDTMTFSVSGASVLLGTGVGATTDMPSITFDGFTAVEALFGSAGEMYSIDGGTPVEGAGNPEVIALADLPTFTFAPETATGASESRYRLNDLSFGYSFETVPEPSSAALLGLGGFALILRRRK